MKYFFIALLLATAFFASSESLRLDDVTIDKATNICTIRFHNYPDDIIEKIGFVLNNSKRVKFEIENIPNDSIYGALIDNSGSIKDDNFDIIKSRVKFVLNNIKKSDVLGVWKVNDFTTKVSELSENTTNRIELVDSIQKEGNYSRLYDSILTVNEELIRAKDKYPDKKNIYLLFFSDGEDILSQTTPDQLTARYKDIPFFYFNYSINFNEQTNKPLLDIAKNFGKYYEYPDEDTIRTLFFNSEVRYKISFLINPKKIAKSKKFIATIYQKDSANNKINLDLRTLFPGASNKNELIVEDKDLDGNKDKGKDKDKDKFKDKDKNKDEDKDKNKDKGEDKAGNTNKDNSPDTKDSNKGAFVEDVTSDSGITKGFAFSNLTDFFKNNKLLFFIILGLILLLVLILLLFLLRRKIANFFSSIFSGGSGKSKNKGGGLGDGKRFSSGASNLLGGGSVVSSRKESSLSGGKKSEKTKNISGLVSDKKQTTNKDDKGSNSGKNSTADKNDNSLAPEDSALKNKEATVQNSEKTSNLQVKSEPKWKEVFYRTSLDILERKKFQQSEILQNQKTNFIDEPDKSGEIVVTKSRLKITSVNVNTVVCEGTEFYNLDDVLVIKNIPFRIMRIVYKGGAFQYTFVSVNNADISSLSVKAQEVVDATREKALFGDRDSVINKMLIEKPNKIVNFHWKKGKALYDYINKSAQIVTKEPPELDVCVEIKEKESDIKTKKYYTYKITKSDEVYYTELREGGL